MRPTIIAKKASNWVDRGEPPNPTLRRVLEFFFERHDADSQPWLEEQANIILGMVAADATEVHIAGYLRSVVRETGSPQREPLGARSAAVALWHIAKAALVRDFAERVLRGEVPVNQPTPDSFSHWIASRLLTPDELARFEAEVAALEGEVARDADPRE
jgi:beta-phosphoglucomutase-like phosphatase (HAD superfamily)